MALVAADIRFFLTGAGSAGGAQSNPALSLGNFRSSTEIRGTVSTFTSTATAPAYILTDTVQIGASHAGKWMLILGGLNAVQFHAYVESFNTGTGAFTLDRPIPANVAIGDTYQLFSNESLFDNISAAQSASGHTDYRCLAVRNLTGVTLNVLKHYFEFISPGGVGDIMFDLSADDASSGDLSVPVSANETTVPDISSFFASGPGLFQSPLLYSGSDQPLGGTINLANNGTRHVWLRRVVSAKSFSAARCALKVVVEATNTGGTPSPIRSACLIPFVVTGFTPALAVNLDRTPRIAGGGRVRATLTATETAAPVEGADVYFDLTAGPGTILTPRDDTDEDGLARSVYQSPTDPLDAGDTVTFRARVAA